jgi:hypothetical protein
MRDADAPAAVELLEQALKIVQVAHGVEKIETTLLHHRDTGRIVSAVLQLAKTFEKNIPARPITNVAYDAAHSYETSKIAEP